MTNKMIETLVSDAQPGKNRMLKETMLLNEAKIPADMNLLNQEMDKNPSLKRLLNMPAKELAKNEDLKNYVYLLGEVLPEENEDNTLLDVIEGCLGYLKKGHSFFSINSQNVLRGFMAYADGKKNCVKQLKMFSFDQKGDATLYVDLMNFVIELCSNHIFVSWSAVNINEVNNAYVLAVQKLQKQGFSCCINKSKKTTRYFVSTECSVEELNQISEEFEEKYN